MTTLNGNESSVYSKYGTCAANGEGGGIPFVDIANAYIVNCGAQFSLPQIAGYNWTQVSSQLNSPSSMIAQKIDGAANTLITVICKVDGGEPASICGQSFATLPLGYNMAASDSPLPVQQEIIATSPSVREEGLHWTD